MKNVYLSFLAAGVSLFTIAQDLQRTNAAAGFERKVTPSLTAKTVLWSNDFSTPTDWQSVATPTNANWVVGTTGPSGDFPIDPIQSPTADNGFALFDADLICASGVQSYLKNSTPINLSGQPFVSISFRSFYKRFNTSQCQVGFSSNGVDWQWIQVHANVTNNGFSFNGEVVSLPAPGGTIGNSSTAYIAFKYVGACDYAWMVDDVEILVSPTYDLMYNHASIHANGYGYSQIPLAQISEITSELGVVNVGATAMTNLTLTTTVSGADTDVMTGTLASSAPGNFPVADTVKSTYMPTGLGMFKFSQAFTTTETDVNTSNNTALATDSFEVNNHIYAIDRGAPYAIMPNLATVFSTSTFPRYEIGVGYDIYQAASLRGIDAMMGTGTAIGTEIYGKLYKNNPDATTWAEVWQDTGEETEVVVIENASQIGTMLTLKFDGGIALEANATYMVSIVDQAKTGRFTYSGFTPNSQVYLIISGTNGAQWQAVDWAPVVRMNFNPALSVANVDALAGVKVYPNPSTGIVNVSNDKGTNNTIVVTDVTGKVVSTTTSASAATINLSNSGAGIYFVEVANETGRFTEKVVIK